MPRPDISVPRPDEKFYARNSGVKHPAYIIFLLVCVLIAAIASSVNNLATFGSCAAITALIVFSTVRSRSLAKETS